MISGNTRSSHLPGTIVKAANPDFGVKVGPFFCRVRWETATPFSVG